MSGRDLKGQVVVVVGASGALGSRVARRLAERGAVVVPAGRDAQRLREVGLDEDPVVVDVTDAGAGDVVRDAVLERHGRVDGVVLASGVAAFGSVAETDDAVVEELFLVNAAGPMFLARRLAEPLAESQGFWVTVSAVLAERPVAQMAAYSASKAAAAAFTQAMATEWRRRKVTVTDVRPPHTETGLAERPIAGSAPRMPEGLDPDVVAERIVRAIEQGEREVASGDFG